MQIQSGSDFNGLFQALLRVHFCWALPLLLEPRGGPALHPASEASIRHGELTLPFSEGLRQPFVRQFRYYKDQAATCKREMEGRDFRREENRKGKKPEMQEAIPRGMASCISRTGHWPPKNCGRIFSLHYCHSGWAALWKGRSLTPAGRFYGGRKNFFCGQIITGTFLYAIFRPFLLSIFFNNLRDGRALDSLVYRRRFPLNILKFIGAMGRP